MPDPSLERAVADLDGAHPTSTRFIVLGVLCLLSGILYLDRICISQALPSMKSNLELSQHRSQLRPDGVHAGLRVVRGSDRPLGRPDRRAARVDADFAVVVGVHGAHGRCAGLGMLIGVRFLFGAGEAGAFPNVARVMSRWFPDARTWTGAGRVDGGVANRRAAPRFSPRCSSP